MKQILTLALAVIFTVVLTSSTVYEKPLVEKQKIEVTQKLQVEKVSLELVRKYTCSDWEPVDPDNPNTTYSRVCAVQDHTGCYVEGQKTDCPYGCPIEDRSYLGDCGVIIPQ